MKKKQPKSKKPEVFKIKGSLSDVLLISAKKETKKPVIFVSPNTATKSL